MPKVVKSGDAETIRILRKQLAKANDLLLSYRKVLAENVHLRQENKILKETVKPIDQRAKRVDSAYGEGSVQRSRVSSSIKTTLDRTTHEDSNDHSSPRSRNFDISKFVKIDGGKYVYHDGELVKLNKRFGDLASMPHFAHPTRASEAKGDYLDEDFEQSSGWGPIPYGPANFLRKGHGTYKYKLKSNQDPSDYPSHSDKRDEFEYRLHRHLDDVDRWELEHLEPPPQNQETFRLEEKVKLDIRSVHLHSSIGEPLLRQGYRLFQESFRAAARAYWPRVWARVSEGPQQVRGCYTEMEDYFSMLSGADVKRVCPYDPTNLARFMKCSMSDIRNTLAHNKTWMYRQVDNLDEYLQEIQKTLLLMGDMPRVEKLRALRDEVIAEAEKEVVLSEMMKGFAELPFEQHEEWDPSFPEPNAWEGLFVREEPKIDPNETDEEKKKLIEAERQLRLEAVKELYNQFGFYDKRLVSRE